MILHGLNAHRGEFATDEIGHRFKLEPTGKQSIYVAAMRRNCQDFEQLAMSFGERLRGHFGFPRRSRRSSGVRRAEAIR